MAVALLSPESEARFWRKVDKTGVCWEWTGWRDSDGYGKFGGRRLLTNRAHRLAYELVVGPIPDDLPLDHLCRNPGCVNPAHLEPVTHRENILRGVGRTAQNARKTHCAKGHPYDEVNTIWRKSGGRRCRQCHNASSRQIPQPWNPKRPAAIPADRVDVILAAIESVGVAS